MVELQGWAGYLSWKRKEQEKADKQAEWQRKRK
jgi:hypothetical protein